MIKKKFVYNKIMNKVNIYIYIYYIKLSVHNTTNAQIH